LGANPTKGGISLLEAGSNRVITEPIDGHPPGGIKTPLALRPV
jgi:hypothetical protein